MFGRTRARNQRVLLVVDSVEATALMTVQHVTSLRELNLTQTTDSHQIRSKHHELGGGRTASGKRVERIHTCVYKYVMHIHLLPGETELFIYPGKNIPTRPVHGEYVGHAEQSRGPCLSADRASLFVSCLWILPDCERQCKFIPYKMPIKPS